MAQKKSRKQEKELVETNLELGFRINDKFTFTDKQKTFLELAQNENTNIMFVEGPAGSSKSFLAVYVALQMLKQKKIEQILYVRSIVESATKKLGSLPGEVDEKFKPWILPLVEKCDEFLGQHITNSLLESERIHCVPVNFLRGSTFKDCVVIADESQNFSHQEILTIITRFGKNCKLFVIGDSLQSDIHSHDFSNFYKRFNDEESRQNGIHYFAFDENDIMRSKLLRFIIKKLK